MSGREKIREQLSAYLDGELSEDKSRLIAEMVAGDPDLSAELESLRTVQSLLRGLRPVQAPDGMADAVLKRTHRRPAGWWMGYLARAAIILLAVGVGITVTTWLKSPTHPRQAGKQTPHDSGKPILAVGRISELGSPATAETTNVFINTDNLLLAQREVERVFGNNSIKPIVEVAGTPKVEPESGGRANFYNQTQVTPKQVRYEVAITDNQMRQIVSELNEIRARQNVAQMPMKHIKEAEALARAKDIYHRRSDEGKAGDGKSTDMDAKKKSGGKALLYRSDGGYKVNEVKGLAGRADSQPASAAATRSSGTERSSLAGAKPPDRSTTTPASTGAANRKVRGVREVKSIPRPPTTRPTANVRQLIVIVNSVSNRE
ncbi:MAG: hypothetical protein K8R91_03255 [Phycisphaerae bacterium]|nr:hypothetical protein [Phycisphaerae bacterium]